MTRSHVKYQIARDDVDISHIETSDYLSQNIPDCETYQNAIRPEVAFWRKMSQAFLLISAYFVLSISLTFYNPWLYKTYVSNYVYIKLTTFLKYKSANYNIYV